MSSAIEKAKPHLVMVFSFLFVFLILNIVTNPELLLNWLPEIWDNIIFSLVFFLLYLTIIVSSLLLVSMI